MGFDETEGDFRFQSMRLSPDMLHELHPIEEIMSKEEQTATYRMPTFTDKS